MAEIRISEVGEILRGNDAGRFIEVIDDAENTGGYLIFTYSDIDRSPDVFDWWLESFLEVEIAFEQSGWVVRWPESSS